MLFTALKRHASEVGVIRVQDVGLRTSDDAEILEFADRHNRVVVSRDRSTMTDAARTRTESGERMAGLLVVRRDYGVAGKGIGVLVRELQLIAGASELEEWETVVRFVPFLYG